MYHMAWEMASFEDLEQFHARLLANKATITGYSWSDDVDGFLKGTRYLIHDRDPLFTDAFREVLSCSRP